MNSKKYTVAMKSIIGTREEQQDCAFYRTEEDRLIAVVCDGMGGLESGRAASFATIEKFKDLYEKKDPAETFPSFYIKIIDILDEHIFHMKSESGRQLKAGTTLVAAAVEKDNLFWLSVGDSRLYILRRNEFVQVTRDHNYLLKLNQMIELKEISERDYQSELAKGEALISFIGMGGIEMMDINNAPFKLQSGDMLLLATDGLYKALTQDEIKGCLQNRKVDEAMEILIDMINKKEHKFQDNTTCVIVRCQEEGDE